MGSMAVERRPSEGGTSAQLFACNWHPQPKGVMDILHGDCKRFEHIAYASPYHLREPVHPHASKIALIEQSQEQISGTTGTHRRCKHRLRGGDDYASM